MMMTREMFLKKWRDIAYWIEPEHTEQQFNQDVEGLCEFYIEVGRCLERNGK